MENIIQNRLYFQLQRKIIFTSSLLQYKQNLKSKLNFNSDHKVFLSEAECNAASKFVAVLEVYDITDERSLKFKEIQCRSKLKLPRLQ